jgi:hypothetical protein
LIFVSITAIYGPEHVAGTKDGAQRECRRRGEVETHQDLPLPQPVDAQAQAPGTLTMQNDRQELLFMSVSYT